MSTLVIRDARIMTCDPARPGLGVLDHGAVAIEDGRVAWVGDNARRTASGAPIEPGGRLVTPGLVDCHAHAIFAGDRRDEFARRAAGREDYLAIARAGGGIAATLAPAAPRPRDETLGCSRAARDRGARAGTTTIEAKSGYDLTVAGELRLLPASRRWPTRAVPSDDSDAARPPRAHPSVATIARPSSRELVDAADPGGRARAARAGGRRLLRPGRVRAGRGDRVLLAAERGAGLAVRAHAGQFEDLGAAELCAGQRRPFGRSPRAGRTRPALAALARAGIVGVMLPGACVQLRLPMPPIASCVPRASRWRSRAISIRARELRGSADPDVARLHPPRR